MGGRRRLGYGLALSALLFAGCSCSEETPADGGLVDGALPDGGAPMDDGGEARMRCGNNEVEGSEACDDGNRDPDDGCSATCALECGDGTVSGDEVCDTAIEAGEEGACPSACDDGDACTTDSLTGAACAATCVHGAITEAAEGDGCCPDGQDATTDGDCTAICGNGIVEAEETCDTGVPAGDPGACPTSCADGMDCTTDSLSMEGTCDAVCVFDPIETAADGDGCCPGGATIATDDDCGIVCGDGVVSSGESCDTAGSGDDACPTACDDGNVCTTDALANGGTCSAQCTSSAITEPDDADGCCPPGGTIATDDDCTATCGDGVVSSGETCDTAIAAGDAGACPTSCDDGLACTTNTLTGAGTCSATCSFPPIDDPIDGDGCCPSGETIGTDDDCPRVCGDGVVTGPQELCDTGIPGSCPTDCEDDDPCTVDTLANAGTCRAQCSYAPTAAGPVDACCPSGADLGDDPDCAPSCGDGVVTPPEACDDDNAVSGDGCSDACVIEPVAFRFRDMDIADPHLFANVFGCLDITNNILFVPGLNPRLQDAITADGDDPPDGLLDLSIAHVFSPLVRTAGSSTASSITLPDCTAPMSSTECTLPAGETRTMASAMNLGSGAVCLAPIARTSSYGGINSPTAPAGGTCYVAETPSITFNLGGIEIALEDAAIAGVWSGSNDIVNGLIRGFMSEAVAEATVIPEGTTDQDAIDGSTIASLLRGGDGSCASGDDRDTLAGTSTRGWYFYLNFTARRVPYTEL